MGMMEDIQYVRELASKSWFKKAVGSKGVECISRLVEFADECLRRDDELRRLVEAYVEMQYRIEALLQDLAKALDENALLELLMRMPILIPPRLREEIEEIARNRPNVSYGEVVKGLVSRIKEELDCFRRLLFEVVFKRGPYSRASSPAASSP